MRFLCAPMPHGVAPFLPVQPQRLHSPAPPFPDGSLAEVPVIRLGAVRQLEQEHDGDAAQAHMREGLSSDRLALNQRAELPATAAAVTANQIVSSVGNFRIGAK